MILSSVSNWKRLILVFINNCFVKNFLENNTNMLANWLFMSFRSLCIICYNLQSEEMDHFFNLVSCYRYTSKRYSFIQWFKSFDLTLVP